MSTQLLASGSNAHGQLANNSVHDSHTFQPCSFAGHPENYLPPGRLILDLASGANHTLLLLLDSDTETIELWGAGDGRLGQLGPGIANELIFRQLDLQDWCRDGYSYKLIAAAWETTYVVLSRGPGHSDLVLSMGANDFGDLGMGSAIGKSRGPHLVNIESLFSDNCCVSVRSITTGPHHVILVVSYNDTNGTHEKLIGWGTSRHEQLGTISPPSAFISLPRILSPSTSINSPILSVAAGSQHTVLLHESHAITAFGSNKKKQIDGMNALGSAVMAVSCTWNGTYTLMQDRSKILGTGTHSRGQLGRAVVDGTSLNAVKLPADTEIISMSCGSEHVICLLQNERDVQIWGWGWNEHGNLGIGTTEDAFLPVLLWTEVNTGIRFQIWAGCGTSWIAKFS